MSKEKTIKFEIVSPERVILKKEILQISAPSKVGEITILPNHIPLVSILEAGVIEIKNLDNSIEIISTSGGFLEVLKDKVVILADMAERAEELDRERIREAKLKAETAQKEALIKGDMYDYSAISAKLEIELARQRALNKWRRIKKIDD